MQVVCPNLLFCMKTDLPEVLLTGEHLSRASKTWAISLIFTTSLGVRFLTLIVPSGKVGLREAKVSCRTRGHNPRGRPAAFVLGCLVGDPEGPKGDLVRVVIAVSPLQRLTHWGEGKEGDRTFQRVSPQPPVATQRRPLRLPPSPVPGELWESG